MISFRYFCLIRDVLHDFVWFAKKYEMYIYCVPLFMSLFTIPSQSIIGKVLPNHWQRRKEKLLLYQEHILAMISMNLGGNSWRVDTV